MKGISLVLAVVIFALGCIKAQFKKVNPFQRVSVPDSISIKLEEAYIKNAKNVNAGKNVFSLLNRNDFTFKDGIYSFQGQGPHFPRRIFIFNNGSLYIFENEGAFNPKGVIKELSSCIEILSLTEVQTVQYSKAISKYLEEELGITYGSEVKN